MQLRQQGKKQWEAYAVDPRKIQIKPDFNGRDTSSPQARAHINWLKSSITARGVDEAIFVQIDGETMYLVDGECRLRACQELWDEGNKVYLPTITFKGDEAAALAKSLAANNGLPLTQMEIGKTADKLQAYGWTIEQIAKVVAPHLGYSPKKAQRHVKDGIELHQAPIEVKQMVREGVDGIKISPAVAIQEVRKGREQAPARIKEAAAKAKAAGKKEIKRPKHPGPAAAKKNSQLERLAASENLALAVDLWAANKAGWEHAVRTAHRAYRKIVPSRKEKS
jgi:ParB-like chromosome segregation protein Spo0J